jgi:hypothetical protein
VAPVWNYVPPLVDASVGARCLYRRTGGILWVNAWEECSRTADTGRLELAEPTRLTAVEAGHMLRREEFRAAHPPERPTPAQKQWRS